MNRSKVVTELHAMVHSRLFGNRPWLADREACDAMGRKLHDMGLDEVVPGEPGTTRATNFGMEQRLNLMMVFMGLFDEWDMLLILEDYGLIDELECDELFERMADGVDPEHVMLGIVRRAYLEFYNLTRLSH